MRPKSQYALLSTALFFLLTGLALRSWELISLLIPMTVLIAMVHILNRPPQIRLEVEHRLETNRVAEGDGVEVSLRIKNNGEALAGLEVEDLVSHGALVAEGRSGFPIALGADEELRVQYRLTFPKRGKYQVGPTAVRWRDPTSTFSRGVTVGRSHEVSVIPSVHDLKKCGLAPMRVRMHAGNVGSKMLGAGSEFYCMRQYYGGDEMRRINWKATARRGALMTNEYESERSGDVAVVLDARGRTAGGGKSITDYGVEVASSLSLHFLRERNRVGMIIVGDVFDVIRPEYGRRQFYKIVDHLLNVRDGIPRSTVGIRTAVRRYLPANAMIVIVSSLQDAEIVNSAKELSSRGHQVTVLSPSWIDVEQEGMTMTSEAVMAARLARIVREDLIRDLRAYCEVIDWGPKSPLRKHLMEVRHSQLARIG